jgi:hypothetical protein
MPYYEDDIRAAFHSLAGQAPDARTVLTRVHEQVGPADRLGHRQPSGPRRSTRRLLIPLAAAAAVIAVIAVAVNLPSGNQTPKPQASVPASSLLHGVPRYYLAIDQARSGQVEVRDTLTGAIVATTRAPTSYTISFVTGAADDRTFVLLGSRRLGTRLESLELFRARFDPADHAITVTPLHIRADLVDLLAMALSPNGAELALSIEGAGHPEVAQIQVHSLTSGTVREWHDPGSVQAMAWGTHGELAIDWAGAAGTPGIAMLNTNTAGGSLTGASRLVVDYQQPGHYILHPDFAVSGDGTTLVIPVERAPWRNRAPDGEIRWYSLATGRETRAYTPPAAVANEQWQVLWSNSSGSVTLLRRSSSDKADRAGTFGILRGNTFAPLPLPLPVADAGFFLNDPVGF